MYITGMLIVNKHMGMPCTRDVTITCSVLLSCCTSEIGLIFSLYQTTEAHPLTSGRLSPAASLHTCADNKNTKHVLRIPPPAVSDELSNYITIFTHS